MRRLLLSIVCFPAIFAGCATAGTGGSTAANPGNPRLAQAEVEAANLPTAYDLVDRLRRPWLRRDAVTGAEVTVYMDNQNLGGAQKLREIPSVDVGELTYLPHDEAVRRWGADIPGSVIVVTRRR